MRSPGAWLRACHARCRALNVPLKTRRLSLVRGRGQSLEAVARAARYAALAGALQAGEVLLTAHHLEDQLETVLLQLLRGAGLPGLAAMPGVMPLGAGFLVRPLLDVPRAQLHVWVQARGWPYLEDPANADAAFDRNYLRHEVLPAIISRWSGAARTVARSAGHLAAAQALLNALAAADVAPGRGRRSVIRGAAASAAAGSPPQCAAVLDRPFRPRGAGCAAPGGDCSRDAGSPGGRQSGWSVGDPHGCSASWAGLSLEAVRPTPAPMEVAWNPRRRPRLALPGGLGHLELVPAARGPIDAAALPARVTVRTRRGGERLRPRIGGPSRTLKSLMQNEAIPLSQRQNLPLVFLADQLVAAGDLWVDARWQATAHSAKRLRLIWHRPPVIC
ncbi:MAG: tRNA lysidine(34) synthetase TilS [Steroidobacteraceae bacterium]